MHIVHQASAFPDAIPAGYPGSRVRLLFAGRLLPLKGLGLLLSALAGYKLGSWTLTVAGDGPDRERLETFASQHHLPVEFPGFVPRARLPELFADHDVFVFPTLTDEWGLVVGEALRAGLPVLGSVYSEAVCELVENGVTGWTMRPDRQESVRAALDQAFAVIPAGLPNLRWMARESVRRLTSEVMADQFLDVLRAVHGAGSPIPAAVQ